MSTMQGPGHYAGLLPVPIRPVTLENNPFPNGQQCHGLGRGLGRLAPGVSGLQHSHRFI
jgi:hypothetical protein